MFSPCILKFMNYFCCLVLINVLLGRPFSCSCMVQTIFPSVSCCSILRSCLEKLYQHFARVNFSMAMRIIFSDVPVRISTSLANLLKFPSQANVLSTIHRFFKTANLSVIRLEIWSLMYKYFSTNITAVPR